MHDFRSVCFHLSDKKFPEATLISQWLVGRLLRQNKRQELSSGTIPQVIARCDSLQISS